ncbi:Protein of unknown function DUF3468 [Penicillium occitanis (nom. inval.)]|nr:hypothetical protein PENOC_100250 [Penicillium occitanis (nom. inval.)]PCG94600.1 Protein of unknown function DUF3468 [Penicillium occitanis (nom. inval.)]
MRGITHPFLDASTRQHSKSFRAITQISIRKPAMDEESVIASRPRKRTRLTAGCEACRIAHVKCDAHTPCRSCRQLQIECVRKAKIRFRYLITPDVNCDVSFPERKIWPKITGLLDFHDETLAIASEYDSDKAHTPWDWELRPLHHDTINRDPGMDEEALMDQREFGQHSAALSTPQERHLFSERDSNKYLTNNPCYSPLTVIESTWSILTDREALLMRNFIEHMALWADVTDPDRHFEIEVPRRALYQPILRYAIFAFSSRHLSRGPGSDETEALRYHEESLQLLISALSAAEEVGNDNILAAAAILRQFEEMDSEDYRCHLSGATRMLNMTPDSTFSAGGLREATSWLCLRQDIYISLVSEEPLRTDLDKFSNSRVFDLDNDYSWANKMVLLLAKLLSCAFPHDEQLHSASMVEKIRDISQKIDEWWITKPQSFEPLRFVPRKGGRVEGNRFPEIWMLSHVHVVGLQYYHTAKALLALLNRPLATSAYENLLNGRAIEKCISHHLFCILGLTQSNPRTENALFTARHCLSAWGGILRHKMDQIAAERLLENVERITGWSSVKLIQSLRGEWDEYHDEEEEDIFG